MCKDKSIKVGLKKLDFSMLKGKFLAYLTDGRQIAVPVSLFPDIKRMPLSQRKEWMILDDQYFTFQRMSKIYSISDLMKI